MNAHISPPTQRDRAQVRDAALEREIEAIRKRMMKAGTTDEESRTACVELAVLIRRRSTEQLLKLEFERWMRPAA